MDPGSTLDKIKKTKDKRFESIKAEVFWNMTETCQQADSSICLTYACCCMYSFELLMMDGKTVRYLSSVT